MLFSLYHIFNAGLIIHKKTGAILYMVAAAALANFILNWLWIPKFGILGAAYSTFASYVGFTLCIAFYSFRFLSFPIPYAKAGIYASISLAWIFTTTNFLRILAHGPRSRGRTFHRHQDLAGLLPGGSW